MELRNGQILLSWACLLWPASLCLGPTQPKPNFILILVDDLGIGDLGCFGNDTLRTPHVDRLAREGTKLTHHIAAASVCTPSRAAFLTGRYPVRSGMASNDGTRVIYSLGDPAGLPRNETTFAELLHDQGYSTALIGKWHQGLNRHVRGDHHHHPSQHGFDDFYGMPYSLMDTCWPDPSRDTELVISGRMGRLVQLLIALAVVTFVLGIVLRWFCVCCLLVPVSVLLIVLLSYFWSESHQSSRYWDCLLMRGHDITEQPMKAERAGSIMVEEATAFLERNQNGPFLLFFSFLHVHTPLPTDDAFLGTSSHGLYGDNVQEMDAMLGKLLEAVDRLALSNQTLVYFASDHGGHLEARRGQTQLGGWNGRFKGGKGMGGWEGGIRVPGIVRWPGQVPAGQVIDEPTSLMDVFPTVAALAGAEVPQDRQIDGRDLMPLLLGQQQHSEHEFLFHYCEVYLHAVRWRPRHGPATWKVHYVTPVFQPPGAQGCYRSYLCPCSGDQVTYHDPPLLFDLSRDPSESTPLTRDTEPLYDVVIRRVGEAAREHRRSVLPVPVQMSQPRNRRDPWLRPCCGLFPFCLCDREGRR
ncbi:arylsulfatase F-like [Sorex fumeus]|uniref:arylsulfatase F-like n=1 Tax=Sorex fumeus TaxID=62283 RepID=UPI0024AC9F4F|nr:arylsulfatase F-like [Sorex fumeus]